MKPQKQNGFSLVEVVIAASLLSFALIMLLSMFTNSYSEIDFAARQSRATYLASDLMEKLKTEPFTGERLLQEHCLLDHGAHQDTVYIDEDGNPETDPVPYVRHWTIQGGPFENDGKKITICHEPPGHNGEKRLTLSVSRNALPAHVRHGDPLGPCPEDGTIPPLEIEVVVEWQGRHNLREYRLRTYRTYYQLGT
ncbi:MAG: hypothetical protein D6675_12630 [Gemmatimonadetes bacterium]|nr:MAG: hypothetical protein D6675_12630 [Gemmatimonadota bacterium]